LGLEIEEDLVNSSLLPNPLKYSSILIH
jgi:hypothetical protein